MKLKKLYDELDITERCALCEKACELYSDGEVLCRSKGVVREDFRCRKFVYDVTKRLPMQSKWNAQQLQARNILGDIPALEELGENELESDVVAQPEEL